MEEQLNRVNQLAQLPESNDRETTITSTRGDTGKVLSMDQYIVRHSVREPQEFFTLSQAVEYFNQNPDAKEAFQDIVKESLSQIKAIEQGNQSVRKAS